MNPNLMQTINRFKKITNGNPRDIAVMMANDSGNPMMKQLVQLMDQGKKDEVENFANNICKEHNVDFREQVNGIKNMINMFQQK